MTGSPPPWTEVPATGCLLAGARAQGVRTVRWTFFFTVFELPW